MNSKRVPRHPFFRLELGAFASNNPSYEIYKPAAVDFEPGALIENRAPSEASNHSEALLQNHEVGDVSANEVDAGDLSRYSLSMLMVDSLGTTA